MPILDDLIRLWESIPQLLRLAIEVLQPYYAAYGYFIVPIAALAENTVLFGLIFPGGTFILLGALYARLGDLSLPAVILLGWLGMFLGTSLDYALGRHGLKRIYILNHRLRRFDARLEQARQYLARYGAAAVLVAHFAGHTRSFIALTAGLSGLGYRRFAVFEAVAALVWNLIFCGVGFLLADNLDLVEDLYHRFSYVVLALVVLGVVGRYIWRRWRRRATGASSPNLSERS